MGQSPWRRSAQTRPVPYREPASAAPGHCEQHEIVRRVTALLALADIVETQVNSAIARTGKVTQSILAKAFRRELVPTEAELAREEARDYEPASHEQHIRPRGVHGDPVDAGPCDGWCSPAHGRILQWRRGRRFSLARQRSLTLPATVGRRPVSQTLKAASRHRPDCARLQAMLPHVDS
jgi:hypothetical protein